MTEKKPNTRVLMMTILLISLIQMPHLAITPGIDLISKEIFPDRSEGLIQIVMALPNVISVVSGILAALLIRYGLARKKTLVVVGILIVSSTGIASLIMNTQFWQLCLLNSLIGIGMGTFIPTAQSIMFDNFDKKERQFISGAQFSFVNGGGIIMSVLGGLLIGLVWYGGHLITLISIPVAIVALITIPKDKKQSGTGAARTKLPRDVYYYTAIIMLFMVMYNVGAYNISIHIAEGGIGDAAVTGIATAAMMFGGVVSGFIFPKLSQRLHDNLFSVSFVMLFVGFSILNLLSSSLAATIAAMFICGASLSLFIPRCILRVSGLTNESNSATATVLIASVAPGVGSFLSPVIITNLTTAIGGASTRFRYQFSAFVCVALAALMLLINIRREKRIVAARPEAK